MTPNPINDTNAWFLAQPPIIDDPCIPPNNDLREAIEKLLGENIDEYGETDPNLSDKILALLKADHQQLLDKLLAELDGLKREKSGWEDSANDPKKLIRLTHNQAIDQCRKIIEEAL